MLAASLPPSTMHVPHALVVFHELFARAAKSEILCVAGILTVMARDRGVFVVVFCLAQECVLRRGLERTQELA